MSRFQSQTRCQAPGDRALAHAHLLIDEISISDEMPGPWRHSLFSLSNGLVHYSGTFPQGHFPGNFPPNGMMANNVPMTRFSPEAFSQEYSLEQQTLRALPVLM